MYGPPDTSARPVCASINQSVLITTVWGRTVLRGAKGFSELVSASSIRCYTIFKMSSHPSWTAPQNAFGSSA